MAVDAPATIAVLGAGPIGLEAALYARFLGYRVEVYERGEVAANVRAWGHVRLFSPFAMNRSSLGLAALNAQFETWQAPADDALLTGHELVERYLLPLSQTDLLDGHVHTHTRVVAVGRAGPTKTDDVANRRRAATPFRILLEDSQRHERVETADIVIDTTGTYGNARWMGQGGIPAAGERAVSDAITYRLPDILQAERQVYANRRTLLVGGGYSAATSAIALAELAADADATRVTWITRRATHAGQPGPIPMIPNDRLAERDRIARTANRLAAGGQPPICHISGSTVESIERLPNGQGLRVHLAGNGGRTVDVDRIIANVGYRPDNRLFAELQVHQCYATEGPMRLAAQIMGHGGHDGGAPADCLDEVAGDATALQTSEPNFYILGSKSYGRDSRFLIAVGLQQVVQLFTIIGGRHDLNLYEGIGGLVPRSIP
jgi:thioredoxin reductase